MADVTFDEVGQRVYAASMSGPYYANYSDLSRWASIRTGMPAPAGFGYSTPIQRILVDPSNASHLLAFQGSKRQWSNGRFIPYVWESWDSGASWANISLVAPVTGEETANIIAAEWAGDSHIWAATPGWGLWRSDDRGHTWTHADAGLNTSYQFGFLATHPTDPSTAWVGYGCDGNGLYKTTDGGQTWVLSSTGLTGSSGCLAGLAVSPSAPTRLYVGAGSSQGNIWRSDDGGVTWQATGGAPSAQAYELGLSTSFLTVDPVDPDTVYVATAVTLWVTHDGGASWRDLTSIQPFPDPLGTRWRGTGFSGLVSRAVAANPWNSSMLVLNAMDAGKVLTSVDSGYSWRRPAGPGWQAYGGGHATTFGADGRTIYAGTGQAGWPSSYSVEGVAVSQDGGVTFAYCGVPAPLATGQGLQGLSVYTLPRNTSQLWAVFQDGHLYSSSNGCANWTQVPLLNGTGGLYNDSTLAYIGGPVSNADQGTPLLFLQSQAGVYNSTDGGATWRLMGGSPSATYGRAMGLTFSKADNSSVWATVCCWDQWHVGAFKYTQGVAGWSQLTPSTGPIQSLKGLAVSPLNASVLAVGTDMDPYADVCGASGVYTSTDGGQTWQTNSVGLPMRRVSAIGFTGDGTGLIAGMNGRGYARADVTALYSGA